MNGEKNSVLSPFYHIGMTPLACFFLLFFFQSAFSQSLKQARQFFKEGQYEKALPGFEQDKKTDKNPDYLIERAICYFHTKQVQKCLDDLKKYEVFNTGNPDVWIYYGLSFIRLGNYTDGARSLKKFLSLSKSDHPFYQDAILEIRRCGFALQLAPRSPLAFIESAGNIINSPAMEKKPVYSPNFQERIYFSSNRKGSTGGKRDINGLLNEEEGKYYLDMYYSNFVDGNWTKPTTFLPLLNTPKHDMVAAFNPAGDILYYLTTRNFENLEYFSDTFKTEISAEKLPKPVFLPVDGSKGDKDIYFFNDSLLLFSSKQLGGLGGYDLFYCQKKDNQWGNPVNMGEIINSPDNDSSPFITKGGNTLYFTSDRIEGFGGTDVFITSYDFDKKSWKKPQNMGLPVNSPWDEDHFIVSPDGINGVYVSDKPGGNGETDLYMAYFKDQVIDQLLFAEVPEFINPGIRESETKEENMPKPREKKDIRLPSVYYTSNNDVLSPSNISRIISIYENMVIYPDTRLTIYGHSFQESSREMDLYLSLKRTESIAQFLIQKGVDPERITLKACGSSYPLAMPYINGIKSNIAEKSNRRIDFKLIPVSSDIHVIQEDYGIAKSFMDEKFKEFQAAEDTFVFRLLIARSQQMYRNEVLNIYDDIYIEKTPGQETNQYMLGNFRRYDEALALQNELSRQHQLKALILPYMNGKLLPPELYAYKMNTWPELKIFMQNKNE